MPGRQQVFNLKEVVIIRVSTLVLDPGIRGQREEELKAQEIKYYFNKTDHSPLTLTRYHGTNFPQGLVPKQRPTFHDTSPDRLHPQFSLEAGEDPEESREQTGDFTKELPWVPSSS